MNAESEIVPVLTPSSDTVELHVRKVPRSIWLKARQAALASRLRSGQYVIKLLEQAEPIPVSDNHKAKGSDQ